MDDKEITKLLEVQNDQINKLHQIVLNTIAEEKLMIDNLLHPQKEIISRGQNISDRIARFGGSWRFILFFAVFLMAWIVYNVSVTERQSFDPYPFILMNLILSCMAAMQAPVIMMSQNRQEEKDRMRSENDYLINLKAEMEIRSLHQKIDLLLEEEVKSLFNIQVEQIKILQDIKRHLES